MSITQPLVEKMSHSSDEAKVIADGLSRVLADSYASVRRWYAGDWQWLNHIKKRLPTFPPPFLDLRRDLAPGFGYNI